MMDKWQAQYTFWSSFGYPAHEENSVPDLKDITYPYITYEAVGALPVNDTFVNVSVYTRSTSLQQVAAIAERIQKCFQNGGAEIRFDGGGFFLSAESNFIQIMGDEKDTLIKRAVFSLVIHW